MFSFLVSQNTLHFILRQLEDLDIVLAADIDIHVVLHKESARVDCRSAEELLNHELVLLKLSHNLEDTVLDEDDRVCVLISLKDNRSFLHSRWLQAEHNFEKDLIVSTLEVRDSLDHVFHELDLLVVVLIDDVLRQCLLVFREFSD